MEHRLGLDDGQLLAQLRRIHVLVHPGAATAAVARECVALDLPALLALQVLLDVRSDLTRAHLDEQELD